MNIYSYNSYKARLSIYAGFILVLATVLPSIAGAATLEDVLNTIGGLINSLIPLVLAITVLIFFWGLAMYLLNTGNTEKKSDGIHIMITGIMAIFVMVSIWGIIGILQNTFQVTQTKPIIPQEIKR